MPFETSSHRLWRTLSRDDRVAAARAFWERPTESAAIAAAREVVSILKVRPQAFGRVPLEQRVRALAGLASPPEVLAEALLLSLHVGTRRELLAAFLDAVGIPHEEGLIAEDAELPLVTAAQARTAYDALAPRFGEAAVRVYWNALWLQDRERWGVLDEALAAAPAS